MLAWHSAGAAPVSSPCDSGECATSVTFRSAQRCSSPLRSGARSSRLYFTCARAARPDALPSTPALPRAVPQHQQARVA